MEILFNANKYEIENVEFATKTLISMQSNSSEIFYFYMLNPNISSYKVHFFIKVTILKLK